MSTHEDNERHFQHWLDKNSWRRDIQALHKEYGASDEKPSMGQFFNPKGIWYHCHICGEEGPKICGCKKPHTDEFHCDALSVIRYLAEALKYRPMLAPCPMCDAPVCIRQVDGAHLCTVCSELAS